VLVVGSCIILTIELVMASFILIFDVAAGDPDVVDEDAEANKEVDGLDPFEGDEDRIIDVDILSTDRDWTADDTKGVEKAEELCS
jgi:hypothetical protein